MYAKNTWSKYKDNQYKDVMDFNEGYKHYMEKQKELVLKNQLL